MDNLPFSALVMVHKHMTNLMSSNDDKFDFVDSNRIPYSVKFNPEIANLFAVADENGFIKFFTSYPKLQPIKEFSAQKSCIYDLQWLNSNEIACGGGDQNVSIFDVNTGAKLALLKGHTESVKSIAQSTNPFVLASGSRDGSVLIFDVRFNRSTDPNDSSLSHIRAVNHINKAHFVEDTLSNSSAHKLSRLNAFNTSSRLGNVLKTKHSNINNSFSTQQSLKKASPVASVLFQSDHMIVSAGATDGLIKVWDTRKIFMSSSVKKNVDPIPLYIFDNQIIQDHSSQQLNLNSKTSKGYSNIIMNHSKSRLYANCMNNYIYEFNYQTYNYHHTRMLNKSNLIKESTDSQKKDTTNEIKKKYHTNQSNYIKSSISQCDKFIITGSSDFNAYIYSTNENSDCKEFRKHVPVIVLKGHTNEVTAVDWNPQNPDQLITCSDDNTIRIWNVKREIDILKSNECNYCIAETINDYEENKIKYHNADISMNRKEDRHFEVAQFTKTRNYDNIENIQFISKFTNRKIAKNLPYITGIFDDFIFTRYEYNHFICNKNRKGDMDEKRSDFTNSLENELCMKWNNINIDTHETTQSSSSCSQNSYSTQSTNGNNSFKIIDLPTPTSNLPKYILDMNQKLVDNNISKPKPNQKDLGIFFNNKFATDLLSMPSLETNDKKRTNRKTQKLRHQTDACLQSNIAEKKLTNLKLTSFQSIEKLSMSTAKKRHAVESTNSLFEQSARSSKEPRTPISKRRLDMNELISKSIKSGELPESPVRTIKDYFSPKPPQNKS